MKRFESTTAHGEPAGFEHGSPSALRAVDQTINETGGKRP